MYEHFGTWWIENTWGDPQNPQAPQKSSPPRDEKGQRMVESNKGDEWENYFSQGLYSLDSCYWPAYDQ